MNILSKIALTLLFASLLVCTGCEQGSKIVPVEGQVLLDGQPLAWGSVMVVPTAGESAFGRLDAQGRFKLCMTIDGRDGCPVGTGHIVAVNSAEAISETHHRRYAPEIYDKPQNSPLKVDIKEPKKDWIIELKGDGKKYPYEFKT
ncbi:DUF4198 domain-containing protein [Anatilimnocola floriformis]|uniref:DUF4198 domain-containing protein n=1 Tax=Anatilimnocola floriformis TaxID=2948575 RepID=UPI0020C48C1C|nr:DUF4198 domain-containing protein [Anatilimnocola floriformis]